MPNSPSVPITARYVGSLLGRFLLPERGGADGARRAEACRLQSVSLVEVVVESETEVTAGERFEAVFEEIGGIRGTVLRSVAGGFVVRLAASEAELDALAGKIAWLKKRHTRAASNLRTAARFAMRGEPCQVTFEGGQVACKLLDISVEGARLSGDMTALPELGSNVRVGSVAARVVRLQPDNIGVAFASPQSLKTLLIALTTTAATAAGPDTRAAGAA